jgi:hypothetical protein
VAETVGVEGVVVVVDGVVTVDAVAVDGAGAGVTSGVVVVEASTVCVASVTAGAAGVAASEVADGAYPGDSVESFPLEDLFLCQAAPAPRASKIKTTAKAYTPFRADFFFSPESPTLPTSSKTTPSAPRTKAKVPAFFFIFIPLFRGSQKNDCVPSSSLFAARWVSPSSTRDLAPALGAVELTHAHHAGYRRRHVSGHFPLLPLPPTTPSSMPPVSASA